MGAVRKDGHYTLVVSELYSMQIMQLYLQLIFWSIKVSYLLKVMYTKENRSIFVDPLGATQNQVYIVKIHQGK